MHGSISQATLDEVLAKLNEENDEIETVWVAERIRVSRTAREDGALERVQLWRLTEERARKLGFL